jgi:hypothetical protein
MLRTKLDAARPPDRPPARQGRSHNTSRFSNGRIKIKQLFSSDGEGKIKQQEYR